MARRATERCRQNQNRDTEKRWVIEGREAVQSPTYACRAWRQRRFPRGRSRGRRCRTWSLPRWSSCEEGTWHRPHLSREPCSIRFCKLDGGTGRESVTGPGCDHQLLAYSFKIKAADISKRSNDVLLAPGEELSIITLLMSSPTSGDTDF